VTDPAIVKLSSSEVLKITFTAKEGTTGKRPHQAFLTLQDPASALEESFAFSVRENGKAKLDLVHIYAH
jgi:oligosaccharyltransferase complex subunit delta (ribophorin II)